LASVGGEIDLATPQGRLTARIKASVGRHESERSSRRIRRKVLVRAEAGKPHGRAAYGWRRVQGRDVIDPGQANIIQATTQRVLAGESLRSLTTDLNAHAVPGPGCGTWDSTKLRQVLLRERNTLSWGWACDLRCLSNVSVNLSHYLVRFLGASFRLPTRATAPTWVAPSERFTACGSSNSNARHSHDRADLDECLEAIPHHPDVRILLCTDPTAGHRQTAR